MMYRYLAVRKLMTEISRKQIECMAKQALCIVLINVLLRPTVEDSICNQYTQEVVKDLKEVEAIKQMQLPINKQQVPS